MGHNRSTGHWFVDRTFIHYQLARHLPFSPGKTLFLFYVLIMRLSAGEPVAIETTRSCYYLFTARGVELSTSSFLSITDHSRIWFLSNSSDIFHTPSLAFLTAPQSKAFLLHCSPPKRSNWKCWMKERAAGLRIMDVWQEDELLALGYAPLSPHRNRALLNHSQHSCYSKQARNSCGARSEMGSQSTKSTPACYWSSQ